MEDVAARDNTDRVDFGDKEHDNRPSADTQNVDVEAQRHHNSISSKAMHSLHRFVSTRDNRQDEADSPSLKNFNRSDTNNSKISVKSLRRRGRAETNTVYGGEEMGRTTGWAPGLEPGIDTSDPPPYVRDDTEHHDVRHLESLYEKCEIMVVDYSPDQMSSQFLDNDNLKEFLTEPEPDWCQVRWINVNGLSWDVIKELGNYKHFHRLAIEDMLNTKNRTKADWYHDHTYVVLPLQKLVNIEHEHQDSSSDEEDEGDVAHIDHHTYVSKEESNISTETRTVHERRRQARATREMKKRKGAIRSLIRDFMRPQKVKGPNLAKSSSFKNASKVKAPWVPKKIRSLQVSNLGAQDLTDVY